MSGQIPVDVKTFGWEWLRQLQPEELETLRQYRFDQPAFEGWRAGVCSGTLSPAANRLSSPLFAPPEGWAAELPPRGSAEAARLARLGHDAISRGELGVVILNGGMATRFGGAVKGLIDVVRGKSFIAAKLEDVGAAERRSHGRIAVFIMTSFATDAATRAHLSSCNWFGLQSSQVELFPQSVSVRLDPRGAIFKTGNGHISLYSTGHGDVVEAIQCSGALSRFLMAGGRYLLMSGVDNVAARVSPMVLGYHVDRGLDVTVEVTHKHPGDVGGAPYMVDNRVQVIEHLRFPVGFEPGIVPFLNVNTFTITAAALGHPFVLGCYYVQKIVEGRPAAQIERLVGEITASLQCSFLLVPRVGPDSRFVPIKEPTDLAAGQTQLVQLFTTPSW